MKINDFIQEEDRKKISAAVEQAEKKSTGEIVPMIVSRSSPYSGARWRFTIFFTLVASSLLYFIQADLYAAHPLAFLFAFIVTGELLGAIPLFKKLSLMHKEVSHEVFKRALLEFYNQKVSKTKNRTGVLIFVSLFERQVMVLADSGINAKVKPGTWDELVQTLIQAIQKNEIGNGFCTAIERCGNILAEYFPASADDQNELSNQLIIKE